MANKWKLIPYTPEQLAQSDFLAQHLDISPILAKLLVQRGITTEDDAKEFFKPDLKKLHNPFLMKDMDKAVERLNKALGNKERIMVYGDYDVDGTTAVALVYKFLQQNTSDIGYYIPDRYTEGYGISYKGMDFAAENGYTLIIALDCGIKAVEKIRYAKERGIDFIICDHHVPDDTLPDAIAVLDAKRADNTYPYDQLSGCGVGFKFMQAFAINNKIELSRLFPLLDLVVVSIASDIVPISGENRILAYHGLKQLNSNSSIGLKSIIEVCGIREKDRELTISDIVFKIGPRINASGRIQTGNESVELLVTKNADVARQKSEEINQYNQTRKGLDKDMTEAANLAIQNAKDLVMKKGIVVYDESWSKGVIGIVASRLTEEYYRPAIVLTRTDNLATGSARSVPGFDIYKAIEHCRELLENFGGHTYAAGLSMKVENVPAFKERFENYVADNIRPEQLIPTIDIDAEIRFQDITPRFFKKLKQFNPFGPENNKPIFCTRHVYDYGTSRLVGKEQEHIKLELVDKLSERNVIMNGIAFGLHEHSSYIKAQKPIDIVYTIEENSYNGNTSIQLLIKDIRLSEDQP